MRVVLNQTFSKPHADVAVGLLRSGRKNTGEPISLRKREVVHAFGIFLFQRSNDGLKMLLVAQKIGLRRIYKKRYMLALLKVLRVGVGQI